MTAGTDPVPQAADTAVAPAPTGIKAKVGEVGLKVYLKAPPKAQNAMLQGFMKAQPVVAKVRPFRRQILLGTGAALAVRKVRRSRS